MNFLSWMLGISLLVSLLMISQEFHESTICRQEAWRGALVLKTRALLPQAAEKDSLYNIPCLTQVQRSNSKITWNKGLKTIHFELDLKGSL